MMSFKRLWQCVALASVLLLVSCSYLPKASTRPPKFVHQVAFESLWSAGGSQGLGDIQMKLYPNFVMHQGQQWLAIPDYRGVMVVVDPFTGKRIWRSKTKMPFSSAAGEDDNAIVMGCSNGQVVALSKEDGEVL